MTDRQQTRARRPGHPVSIDHIQKELPAFLDQWVLKRHHAHTLALVSHMAYVLGFQIEPGIKHKKKDVNK